jgi:hypothetical protein
VGEVHLVKTRPYSERLCLKTEVFGYCKHFYIIGGLHLPWGELAKSPIYRWQEGGTPDAKAPQDERTGPG